MFAVYDTKNCTLSQHETWEDAKKEYEKVKRHILNSNPTGGEKVMIYALQKTSTYVDDETKGYKWLEEFTSTL